MQVLDIRDQSCTAGLGIAMSEGYQRRLITSSLVFVRGSSRTAWFYNAEFFVTDHEHKKLIDDTLKSLEKIIRNSKIIMLVDSNCSEVR